MFSKSPTCSDVRLPSAFSSQHETFFIDSLAAADVIVIGNMLHDWSVDDRLHEITAPALVLWGSQDIEVPRVYSERLVAGLPHAVLSVIEGSGHKTCSEKPAEFNKAEQAFVNSPKGKDKISKGPNVRAEEEADLAQAEQRAKARGKNDDSSTTKMK